MTLEQRERSTPETRPRAYFDQSEPATESWVRRWTGNLTFDAAVIVSGVFPVARLGTGTPDGTKFLRDDGVFATPSGGGGGGGIELLVARRWTLLRI